MGMKVVQTMRYTVEKSVSILFKDKLRMNLNHIEIEIIIAGASCSQHDIILFL